jgi:peptidoglycan/LPS O-acetylase OafA/YrhL
VLSARRIPILDGMRGVGILGVIAYHFGLGVIPADLGLSMFFVLSGFLITWLLLREWHARGDVSLRRFYARRTLRIFPAYYVFLAVSFAADRVLHDAWPPGLGLAAVGYLVNYYNALHGHPTTTIAHAWSLSVEEQFYVLWPLVFVWLARRGQRALVYGLATLIVAGLVWQCYAFLGLGASPAYVYNAFDTRFPNLGMGCLLAVCADRPWIDRFASKIAGCVWLPVATVGLLLWSRLGVGRAYHYSMGFTVDALLIAILLIQLLQLRRRALWSWLDHPVLRSLGGISYPIYLYHVWGISAAHHLTFLPMGLQLVAAVLASVILALGSYFLIERRFLALKQRFDGIAPARRCLATPA